MTNDKKITPPDVISSESLPIPLAHNCSDGTSLRVMNILDSIPMWSPLFNVSTDDSGWGLPIAPIYTWDVLDPHGRTINYSASGLPFGLSINPSTGVISGMYDALGAEIFTITVTATPVGGSNPLVRSFTLNIVDHG